MKQSSRQKNTTYKLVTTTNLRINEYKQANISKFCTYQVLYLLKILKAVLKFPGTRCLFFYSQEQTFVDASLYRHIENLVACDMKRMSFLIKNEELALNGN